MNLEIFFRLFNFTILLALSAFLFKKNVLPYFRKIMRERNKHVEDLNREIIVLKDSQQRVTENKIQQMKYCDEWKEKIKIWKDSWEENRDTVESSFLKNQQELVEKRDIQTRNFEIYQQFEAVKSDVISNAASGLKKIYENNETHKEYIDKIIAMLK